MNNGLAVSRSCVEAIRTRTIAYVVRDRERVSDGIEALGIERLRHRRCLPEKKQMSKLTIS
jgi:hypothetical protein